MNQHGINVTQIKWQLGVDGLPFSCSRNSDDDVQKNEAEITRPWRLWRHTRFTQAYRQLLLFDRACWTRLLLSFSWCSQKRIRCRFKQAMSKNTVILIIVICCNYQQCSCRWLFRRNFYGSFESKSDTIFLQNTSNVKQSKKFQMKR